MFKKGFAPIIIILIIALLAAGGITGYTLIKNKQLNKETTTITSVPSTTVSLVQTTSTTKLSILYKSTWDDGALEGAFYRSLDDGKNWILIKEQYKGQIIYDYDKRNPQIVYYADTGFNMMGEGGSCGFFKSIDGGKTSEDISDRFRKVMNTADECFEIIHIDSNNSNNVYVYESNNRLFWKSIDGGNTWVQYIPDLSICDDCKGYYLPNTQRGACDQERCYIDVASELKDLSICDKLTNSDSLESGMSYHRDNCYEKVAVAKKDLSICDKIQVQYLKTYCYNEVLGK